VALADETKQIVKEAPTGGYTVTYGSEEIAAGKQFGVVVVLGDVETFVLNPSGILYVNQGVSEESLVVFTNVRPAAFTGLASVFVTGLAAPVKIGVIGALEETALIDNTAPIIGETLTATLGGSNNTGELHYAWKAGGTAVGDDSETYVTTLDDLGKKITVTISSSVEYGDITSEETAAVTGLDIVSAVADNETGLLVVTLSGDITEAGAAYYAVEVEGGLHPLPADQVLTLVSVEGSVITYSFTKYVADQTETQEITFIIYLPGFSDEDPAFAYLTIDPQQPIASIKIVFLTQPAAVSVAKGKTVQLIIETIPANLNFEAEGYRVTWKSLSTAKATVNESTGLVTGKAAGIAIIQATITNIYDDSEVITINYTVTVK
jgi:uncharacterized protein YjdB